MLQRNLSGDSRQPLFHAEELADGIPTVAGLAMLCSRCLAGMNTCETDSLHSPGPPGREAMAILAAARERGMIEIRGQAESFDATLRLIAVSVELTEERRIVFRRSGDAAWTMGFLEGFRRLCRDGFVVHQYGREFVLSASGFAAARALDPQDFREELEAGIEEEI